ncbi:MAG: 4-hydroxy-tetrahydrodipicolinate reductase [marine bacterium B5-7]|nr:MAG: 4-hydroxy-tetrahydrodipicolinate reductase [marine bacterium B5-7]
MTQRILINGIHGKMGAIAKQAVDASNTANFVVGCSRHDDLALAIKEHNITTVIDFTTASTAFQNTQTIIEQGAHPIIGTSGLLPNHIDVLQKTCQEKKLGGIIAPNFSLGAVLLMQCAQSVSSYFSHAEIIEMHHDKKADAPSGTAIKTAQLLEKSTLTRANSEETIPHARGATLGKIPIHAVRLPGMLAREDVIFGNPGETLTISHNTLDRSAFMPGILLALEKVSSLNELVYGLEHLL